MKNILIVFYVPKNTIKFNNWVDGFTSALEIISKQFNIIKYNLATDSTTLTEEYLKEQKIDLVLIKSNWSARVDRHFRSKFANTKVKKGLLISGSLPPPDPMAMNYYDVLFYETNWYKKFIKDHPNIVHAFGINTEIMQPMPNAKKIYDWLTVGKFAAYKRQTLLVKKKGKKLAIGELPTRTGLIYYFTKPNRIVRQLKSAGVEIADFISYEKLCEIYNQSKNLYIPAKLHGGGERAILEARSCQMANIEIEPDNEKLKSLLDGPIYSHTYYAEQLAKGINQTT